MWRGEHQHFQSCREGFCVVRQGCFLRSLSGLDEISLETVCLLFLQFHVCLMGLLIGFPNIQRVARECFHGGREHSYYLSGKPHCKLNNVAVLFTHFSLLWVWLSWVSLSEFNDREPTLSCPKFPIAMPPSVVCWERGILPCFLSVTDSNGIYEPSLLGLLLIFSLPRFWGVLSRI